MAGIIAMLARATLWILAQLAGVIIIIIAIVVCPRSLWQWIKLRGKTRYEVAVK
jgi:hypothetical protein